MTIIYCYRPIYNHSLTFVANEAISPLALTNLVMADISDHARVLHKLYYELSSTVDAQTVASHMFERSALEQRDLESIQSKRSEPTRAAEQLLDIVMEKSRSVYYCFLQALKQSHQEHLQKMIILESSESEFNAS